MGIGARIRQLRERAGMTQEDLAAKIGVTPSAVGNYEREVSHPREDVLYRMFSALCAQPNELFRDFFEEREDERVHIEKYRALDEAGKRAVDDCTEAEYRRCTAQREGMLFIAARGNGAPHYEPLKKKEAPELPKKKGGGR